MATTQKNTQEARMERKINLAKERDTRVVITRTIDTMRVLNIAQSADRSMRIIRQNLLIRYKPEEVLPLIEEYQNAVEKLHIVTAKMCQKTGVPYKPPTGLTIPPAVGSGKEAKKEKSVDEIMEAVYPEEKSDKKK